MDLEIDKDKEPEKDIAPTSPINNHAEIRDVVITFYEHRRNTEPDKYRNFENTKKTLFNNSIAELDKLIRIDKYTLDEIKSVLNFVVNDSFWSNQVYSLARLRRKSGNGETKFKNMYLKYKSKLGVTSDDLASYLEGVTNE